MYDNPINRKLSSYLSAQKELLDLFNNGLLNMEKLCLEGNVTISDVISDLDANLLINTSTNIFPNHVVVLYQERKLFFKATAPVICAFSGGVIKTGSLYYAYRPMLYDFDDKQTYILKKTIKCEPDYVGNLPTNVVAFEQLNERMKNAYVDKDEEAYNLSCNLGQDGFEFIKLKKGVRNGSQNK